MQLSEVVPFGRSLGEYTAMFHLSEADFQKTILGVGDGPASFNAEATRRGARVISIDPIYNFTETEIQQRFYAVLDGIIDQVRATPADWVWTYHTSPDDLRQNRIRTLETFAEDYDRGKQEGRYRVGALPKLDFADNTFDLALCSHLMFLYSEQLDGAFHLNSLLELLRVSKEVRVFPLLTLMLERSPHLDLIVRKLRDRGYFVATEVTSYELQKGGNEMLIVRRNAI